MNIREYANAQAVISRALVVVALRLFRRYRTQRVTRRLWVELLRMLFDDVRAARLQSAELGRRFYDEQRRVHHPDLPRHDALLADYKLEWFIRDMEPAFEDFAEPGATEEDLEFVALRAVRSVENGARRTIMQAVDSDPAPRRVRWARIATGRETCGFCMMLVSRGPVYLSAKAAGLNLDSASAEEMWLEIEKAPSMEQREAAKAAFAALMTKWHTGCDCLVVPVFDVNDWPGRTAFLRAQELWREHAKGRGRVAMNAFRRAIDRGAFDITEMSAAA